MRELYSSQAALAQAFPHFSHYFESCGDADTGGATVRSYRRWLERLERALGRKGSLLDIGCGTGLFLAVAAEAGWHASGVDFGRENIEHARARGLDVACADAYDLDPRGQFDAVSLWDVVEHVEDPLKLLRHVRGLVSEKGRVLAALPRESNAYTWVGKAVYRATLGRSRGLLELLYPSEHLTYYDRRCTERLFGAAGFGIERYATENSDLARLRVHPAVKLGMRGLNALGAAAGGRTRILVVARPAGPAR
jgi:SAM-dependent methyltransferase